jgi:hypothetical protein
MPQAQTMTLDEKIAISGKAVKFYGRQETKKGISAL